MYADYFGEILKEGFILYTGICLHQSHLHLLTAPFGYHTRKDKKEKKKEKMEISGSHVRKKSSLRIIVISYNI